MDIPVVRIKAKEGELFLDLDLAKFNNHRVIIEGAPDYDVVVNLTNSDSEAIQQDTPIYIDIQHDEVANSGYMLLDSDTYHAGPNLRFYGLKSKTIHDWETWRLSIMRMPEIERGTMVSIVSYLDPTLARLALVAMSEVYPFSFYP